MRNRIVTGLLIVSFAIFAGHMPLTDRPHQSDLIANTSQPDAERRLDPTQKLPLLFIQNQGQLEDEIEYYAKSSGQTVYFTRDNIVFDLIRHNNTGPNDTTGRQVERLAFRLDFIGVTCATEIQGSEIDAAVVHHFIGDYPDKWHTGISTFRNLIYKDIYPHIDLKFHGRGTALQYDFIVYPGANPDEITLAFSGIADLSIENEELVVNTAFGNIQQSRPIIYQQVGDEKIPVTGGFRLLDDHTYGFAIATYDPCYPLIVDPTIDYSTYLGGSNADFGHGIAVDSSGCAYITGETGSLNFPTQTPYQGSFAGSIDAFVTKLSAGGNSLVYSTYLGGSAVDIGQDICIDNTGCAYITGYTYSSNFPTFNAYQGYSGGGFADAFITKLSATGNSLVYSTFLGGAADDYGLGISVDSSWYAYITGYTVSSDFPVNNPYQGAIAGVQDAFITKLSVAGNSLIYSTYMGGSNVDAGLDIAVNTSGNACITGETLSIDFPTRNPFQGANSGAYDAFVSSLSAAGDNLTYSTYMGGNSTDSGRGISIDGSGCVYITGYTLSPDFTTQAAFQGAINGGYDGFITKFSAAGNTLVYSTYIGGTDNDYGDGIFVDGSGNACITGRTLSTNFPVQNPVQATNSGSYDAFVTRLASAGNRLNYSTYLGGVSDDYGEAIAVDGSGNAYITGWTDSNNFPTNNPYQGHAGGRDAFITKFSLNAPTVTITPATNITATSSMLNMTYSLSDYDSVDVRFAYKRNDSPGWTYTPWAADPDSPYSSTVTGLIANNTYSFKGQLQYGSTVIEGGILQFTTGKRSDSVSTASGTGTATFELNHGTLTGLTAINQSALVCGGIPGISFPHGFFTFNITDIPPGSTVLITITLPTAMPSSTQYWKCMGGNWVNVSSLLGSNDGDNILTLTLTDGQMGDGDGVANGVISDPGGPAVSNIAISTSNFLYSSATSTVSPAPPVALPTVLVHSASLSTTTVPPGTPITLTADVINKGTVNGIKKITVYVNGRIESTQGVTVGSGNKARLVFNITRDQPGTYTVYVDSVYAGSFTVDDIAGTHIVLIISLLCITCSFVMAGILFYRRITGQ